MNWIVVVNPMAAGGAAGRNWPSVKSRLEKRRLDFSCQFTSSPEATRRIVARAIDSRPTGIAVYGGDGTLSDTASVLVERSSSILLSPIPSGSGNDWVKSLGYKSPSVESAINTMVDPKPVVLDAGVARWQGGSRFFLNSAGCGLDAHVLQKALSIRRYLPFPKAVYMLSLAMSSLKPPVWQGRFLNDGTEFHRGGYVSFTAGVGKYSGGGMLLSPTAEPNDGLLDGLCLSPMNFLNIAGNIGRIFDGSLHLTPWARHCRGSVVRIELTGGRKFQLELDGEAVYPSPDIDWIEFHTLPGSLIAAAPRGESG